MFRNRLRRSQPTDPVTWPPMEDQVYMTLYGEHTRSGEVTPIVPTVWAVVGLQDFHVVEPWADWDSIRWDWPENPERVIDGHARLADFNIAHLKAYAIMALELSAVWNRLHSTRI